MEENDRAPYYTSFSDYSKLKSDSLEIEDPYNEYEYEEEEEEEENEEEEEEETSRLEIYTDAIFSILCTICILPLMEALKEEENPSPHELYYNIIYFFFCFHVIGVLYRGHNVYFSVAEHINLTIIFLNTLYIMMVALIPFTFTLIAAAPLDVMIPIIISIVVFTATLIGWILRIYIVYSSPERRKIVAEEDANKIEISSFNRWYIRVNDDISSTWNYFAGALHSLSFSFITSLLVIIFDLIFPGIWVYGYFMFIVTGATRMYVTRFVEKRFGYKRQKKPKKKKKQSVNGDYGSMKDLSSSTDNIKKGFNKIVEYSLKQRKYVQREYYKNERVDAFTDGIFAISITLVAVNLRPPEVELESTESSETIDYSDFNKNLAQLWPQFLAYGFSFLYYGMIWYLNHKMFTVIKKFRQSVFNVNYAFLMFIVTLPAGIESVFSFNGTNISIASNFFFICIFFVGILQTFSWYLICRIPKYNRRTHLLSPRNKKVMYLCCSYNLFFGAILFIISIATPYSITEFLSLFVFLIPVAIIFTLFFSGGWKKT